MGPEDPSNREKIPTIFLKPNFVCKSEDREQGNSKVRAPFLTFPHEKNTFQWSKVVSEAIFPTYKGYVSILTMLKNCRFCWGWHPPTLKPIISIPLSCTFLRPLLPHFPSVFLEGKSKATFHISPRAESYGARTAVFEFQLFAL